METFTDKEINSIKKKIPFNNKGKILSISHFGCMDGTISTIPIHNSYDQTTYLKCTPGKVDEALSKIDGKDYDAIIMTDISCKDKKIYDGFNNLILIDHHETAQEQHDPSKMRFVYMGNSAGVLTRKFMSKYSGNNFEYLRHLSVLGEDYDLWIHDHSESKGLNELHYHYKCDGFIKRFGAGDMNFTSDERSFIDNRWKTFKNRYDEMDVYEMDSINGCMVMQSDFINDICHRLMEEEGFDVVVCKNPRTASCSIRSKHPELNIGNILKELGSGGGHKLAGGIIEKDPIILREKLVAFEKAIYIKHQDMRTANV